MNWMKYRPLYFLLSSLIIIPGIYSLITFGLKLSIEFTGGTQAEFSLPVAQQQNLLLALSTKNPQVINKSDTQFTLKMSETSQDELELITQNLGTASGQIKLESFEVIGPVLGKETLKKTGNALLISSTMLLIYISYAFKQFKYGLSAVLAMLHDTLVLLGSFSLLGRFAGVEVDLLFVTAVLTILSFSVHDTIVVYDRIRELSHKVKNVSFENLVNQAVSETMVRSLNNSLTIIFMLIAMFLMGGESTKYFSLALLIGTITGTYSSTFTAAPLLVVWNKLFERK
jgi:preprotein translocase subunit SecF